MDEGKTKPFVPGYPVPPGETLNETIQTLGVSQAELSRRINLSPKTVNLILKGKATLSSQTALGLEKVTGVPAHFWNNLESGYQEARSRIDERAALAKEIGFLDRIPVRELVQRNVIEDTRDKVELLCRVFTFFQVSDTASWERVWLQPSASFRQAAQLSIHPGAVAAWLRLGQLEATRIDCGEFSRPRFRSALKAIRGMTRMSPSVYGRRMVDICAESGVALVFVPEIRGARAWGACWWSAPTRAVIQLSLRYKWEDHFWFSFFHEAGHLLLHGKRDTFVDFDGGETRIEEEANRFASRHLIPGKLPKLNRLREIEAFAARIDLHAGVVVGRLQHDKVLPPQIGNRLRRKLEIADGLPVEVAS